MDHSPQRPLVDPGRSVTFRAFLIGLIVCVLIGLAGPYGMMIMRGSQLYTDFSTAGAQFLIFMTVLLFNVGIKRLIPGAELQRGELVTVAVMAIIASSLTTMGLTGYLLPNTTAPYYFASPDENKWTEHLLPELNKRPWMAPVDWNATGTARFEPIRLFYEGLPRERGETFIHWLGRVPWGAWAGPLASWAILLAGLYAVMISLMVILRRQWQEHERLVYPIAQLPNELIESADPKAPGRPLWMRTSLWIGFSIPFVMGTWQALARYVPGFPAPFRLIGGMHLFDQTVWLHLRVSFAMIGFAFLINRDVALSIWLFNVLSVLTRGMFNRFGIKLNQDLGCYGAWQKPILAHQCMGAMIVLVAAGLWVARHHLAAVFRKAFTGRGADDSDEILSYRSAVLLFLGGMVIMVCWMHESGLAWPISVYFVLAAVLIFVGLTRVVVEGGMAVTIAPMIAPTFVMTSIGTKTIGPAGVTALVMSWVWMSDVRTFVMAGAAHGLKLAQGVRGNRRPLFWAMVLAIIATLVVSIGTLLIISYDTGGVNLHTWFYINGPKYPFNYGASHIETPQPVNWQGWAWTGVGATIMTGLMLGRRFFVWWPLHPVGFPISAVNWTDYLWASIMIAWLVKTLVLRYGGPRLFRQVRPFFLGLILGQLSVSGLWFVIDLITGKTGNPIFSI
jgi:uncharacterized protein DUF6785/uncharacterized protein DUF6784